MKATFSSCIDVSLFLFSSKSLKDVFVDVYWDVLVLLKGYKLGVSLWLDEI